MEDMVDDLDNIPSLMRDIKLKAPLNPSVIGRGMEDVALTAKEKLEHFVRKKEMPSLTHLCATFDNKKRGTISYSDFKDVLNAAASGLTEREVQNLAYTMDETKIGAINYGDIIPKLDDFVRSTVTNRSTDNPSSKNSSSKIPSRELLAPPPPAFQNSTSFQTETARTIKKYEDESNVKLSNLDDSGSIFQILASKDFDPVYKLKSSEPNWVVRATGGLSSRATHELALKLFNRESEGPTVMVGQLPPKEEKFGRRISRETRSPSNGGLRSNRTAAKPLSQSLDGPIHSNQTNGSTVVSSVLDGSVEHEWVNSGTKRAEDRLNFSMQTHLRQQSSEYPHLRSASRKDAPPPPLPATLLRSRSEGFRGGDSEDGSTASSKQQPPQHLTSQEISSQVLENNVLVQLDGRLGRLRQALKKSDRSGSGQVSIHEFRTASKDAGIQLSNRELDELFHKNTGGERTHPDQTTNTRCLDIDSYLFHLHQHFSQNEGLVKYINQTSLQTSNNRNNSNSGARNTVSKTSGLLSHDNANTLPLDIERKRVIKKVISATSDLSRNPLRVFREINPNAREGWLPTETLRGGLRQLGADLSESEFHMLLDEVDPHRDGHIDLHDLNRQLDQRLHVAENQDRNDKIQSVQTTSKIKEFVTNEILQTHRQPTYDTMANSRDARAERLQWSKLRATIQDRRDAVKRVFSGDEDGAIPVSELKLKLTDAGVGIGYADGRLLERYVARQGREVTLKQVCDAVGIEVATDTRNQQKILVHPLETEKEGGVLSSANPVTGGPLSNPNRTYSGVSFFDPDRGSLNKETFCWKNTKKRVDGKLSVCQSDPALYWGTGNEITTDFTTIPIPKPTTDPVVISPSTRQSTSVVRTRQSEPRSAVQALFEGNFVADIVTSTSREWDQKPYIRTAKMMATDRRPTSAPPRASLSTFRSLGDVVETKLAEKTQRGTSTGGFSDSLEEGSRCRSRYSLLKRGQQETASYRSAPPYATDVN